MIDYQVKRIPAKEAMQYICKYHYSHGCHNGPSPCYGLFEQEKLIGVCLFAVPCSERVRASVLGEEYKSHVTEIHRLHILDCTPKNTESWFISRCLKLLKKDKPGIWAVIAFSDLTAGHTGVIYKASNVYRLGTTRKMRFYINETGRLRHPRQCGHNTTVAEAKEKGGNLSCEIQKTAFCGYCQIAKGRQRSLNGFQNISFKMEVSKMSIYKERRFWFLNRRKKAGGPTAAQARRAGQIIKQFCNRRTTDDACKACPIHYMCETPPYTWEE